jgi:16S rRNA processing protein RimM
VDADLSNRSDVVLMGQISGAHGILGWVKVRSDTSPQEAIFEYQPWLMGAELRPVSVRDGRRQGRHLVAQLDGVSDRDAAEGLKGQTIAILRNQLPRLPKTQFYWADLVGLRVSTREGVDLGTIREIIATGANDVLVVQGDKERLIPFVTGQYVHEVDLGARTATVDWDPDF